MILLKGNALAWASAVWDNQSPISQSFICFTTEMGRVFDHPVRGSVAPNRLLTVRQGSRSVEDYAVEFRITAAETGWNDEALQGAFKNGLCERLKDELAPREDSGDLNELITLVIRLDSRLLTPPPTVRQRNPCTWVGPVSLQLSAHGECKREFVSTVVRTATTSPLAPFDQKSRLASDIGSSGEPSPFSLYSSAPHAVGRHS
ncbi:hypothetical protein DPEC_G00043990 [Dallia pectoralis]|uniref:Uncharacterized protein n=1 Tax=Dallia pectoralis TaxID=75939 RepID=A0ACC2H9A4_DALPE|nr:hypothetical protein DPEC_G00043990 [Dallia pectoralis]